MADCHFNPGIIPRDVTLVHIERVQQFLVDHLGWPWDQPLGHEQIAAYVFDTWGPLMTTGTPPGSADEWHNRNNIAWGAVEARIRIEHNIPGPTPGPLPPPSPPVPDCQRVGPVRGVGRTFQDDGCLSAIGGN